MNLGNYAEEFNHIPQANINIHNEKNCHQGYADLGERFILFWPTHLSLNSQLSAFSLQQISLHLFIEGAAGGLAKTE